MGDKHYSTIYKSSVYLFSNIKVVFYIFHVSVQRQLHILHIASLLQSTKNILDITVKHILNLIYCSLLKFASNTFSRINTAVLNISCIFKPNYFSFVFNWINLEGQDRITGSKAMNTSVNIYHFEVSFMRTVAIYVISGNLIGRNHLPLLPLLCFDLSPFSGLFNNLAPLFVNFMFGLVLYLLDHFPPKLHIYIYTYFINILFTCHLYIVF